MTALKWTQFAAATILLTGSSAAHATQARYDCGGGTQLTAQFSPPGAANSRATLTFAGSDREVVLPQVMSADGGRYANDKIEFWIKGRSATLTRDGKSQTCKTQ